MTPTTELKPGIGGRWLLTTAGETHLFDLDEMTWLRVKVPGSPGDTAPPDGVPQRIIAMDVWPKVSGRFLLAVEDPTYRLYPERWHRCADIITIEQIQP